MTAASPVRRWTGEAEGPPLAGQALDLAPGLPLWAGRALRCAASTQRGRRPRGRVAYVPSS